MPSPHRAMFVVIAVVVVASGLAAGGGGAADGPANATEGNATVPLVTGQTVTVVDDGGDTRYRTDAERTMHTVETDRGTYVFPQGVDFDRYDPALFNVDRLRADPRVDDSVPVLVTNRGGGAAADATDGSLTVTRRLPDLDAVAGTYTPTDRPVGSAAVAGQVVYDAPVRRALDTATDTVRAPRARERFGVSGEGVTVAVIDSGVDASHPDITETDQVRFVDGDDEDGAHGTHVAGILAGDGTASDGTYTGVAPNASILDLDVFDGPRTSTSAILDALSYASDAGADVVSMSLGGGPQSTRAQDVLAQATDDAVASGSVVVVAAGNDGPNAQTVGTPGIAERAITVGATGENASTVAGYSSRGPTPGQFLKPDIVAPGTDIVSANGREGVAESYVRSTGTSMATPLVSGAAALLLEANPDLDPAAVEQRLVGTADPVSSAVLDGMGTEGPATVYDQGGGQLDVEQALSTGVTAAPAAVDFGVVGGEGANRTLRFENDDDRAHTLSLSVRARNLADRSPTDVGTLNRTTLTVPADGTAAVELGVAASAYGAYGGHVVAEDTTADSEQTVPFGGLFANTVTVEKRALPGESVSGDTVVVRTPNDTLGRQFRTITEGSVTVRTLSAEVWVGTLGESETTGAPILLGGATTADSVVLDERDSVPLSVDAGRLTERGQSVRPVRTSVGATYAVGPSVLDRFSVGAIAPAANSTTVRLSPGARDVTVERLFGIGSDTEGSAPLDVPEVVWERTTHDAVESAVERRIDPDQFRTRRVTYHHDGSPDYGVVLRRVTRGPGLGPYAIGDRHRQTLRTDLGAERAALPILSGSGSDGRLERGRRAPETRTVAVGRGPYQTALLPADAPSTNGTAIVRALWVARAGSRVSPDGTNYRVESPNATRTVEVTAGGETVVDRSEGIDRRLGSLTASVDSDGTPIPVEMTAETRLPGDGLSNRTRSTLSGTYDPSAETDPIHPPSVRILRASNLTTANGVADRPVTLSVAVTDYRENESVTLTGRVATDGDDTPFGGDWTTVPVSEVGSDGERTRFTVTLRPSALGGGPIDLALRARDESGNTGTTVVDNAFAVESGAGPHGVDLTGDGNPATDPDADGFYEDVDGDGSVTVADVQSLLAASDPPATLFDADNSGAVTAGDAAWLFDELLERRASVS